MISDTDYNYFKDNLFLDSTYPLLHETSIDKVDSILQNGIYLKKEYNVQIDRVLSIPKSEDEFKNYHYHASINNPAVVVVSIPKKLFKNIPLQSSTAHLFLNCLLEKENSSPIFQPSGMKVYPVKFQKYASTLPNVWINGYFSQSTGYVCNPEYILRQENSHDLLASEEASIWKKFHETYPEEAYRALHVPDQVQNSLDTEYEK